MCAIRIREGCGGGGHIIGVFIVAAVTVIAVGTRGGHLGGQKRAVAELPLEESCVARNLSRGARTSGGKRGFVGGGGHLETEHALGKGLCEMLVDRDESLRSRFGQN